jgi:transposase-like protein
LLEAMRWPNGPVCPHCGSRDVKSMKGKAHRAGLYNCHDCREQFTATVGTVMESSHLPLHFWMYAIHAMSASKKGISALQLQRELSELYDNGKKVSYRTAWFLCHRIREAMRDESGLLGSGGGHVEVDETYVGGKPRKGGKKYTGGRGKGTPKTPVVALVERGGRAKARVIADVTAKTLNRYIRRDVCFSANLCTDEFTSYVRVGKEFASHLRVNHALGQYVGPDGGSTNTAESFFAILKRGVYGSFHNVSKKHLNRYLDEFCYRWNHRQTSDSDRALAVLTQVGGKRLTYKQPGSDTNPYRSRAGRLL